MTRSISGTTMAMPRRACARLVTLGVADPEELTAVSLAASLLLLVGRVQLGGDLFGGLLAREEALDAVEHGVVERLGRQDVDVVSRVAVAASELGGIRQHLGEERRHVHACRVDRIGRD